MFSERENHHTPWGLGSGWHLAAREGSESYGPGPLSAVPGPRYLDLLGLISLKCESHHCPSGLTKWALFL